jgi:hypothetical protein
MACADATLPIEEIITEKGRLKLDVSLSYTNNDRQRLDAGERITVQVSPTSFISLPTTYTETRGNSDVLVGTAGLRYGIGQRTEIFARTSYLYSAQRLNDREGVNATTEHHFQEAWLGINHQLKNQDAYPAFIGFVEAAM